MIHMNTHLIVSTENEVRENEPSNKLQQKFLVTDQGSHIQL